MKMTITKIKSINTLSFELPIDKGLYAITGQNASGKSTIVACASTVFFNMQMNNYFGKNVENGASILFELNGATRRWDYHDGWKKAVENGSMRIKGFYEGSLIFGNRFRDTNFAALKKIDRVKQDDLVEGSAFIKKNLGIILQNDEKYYEKIFKIEGEKAKSDYGFNGEPYFYERHGKRVSQIYMSTGENLLLSILHSLNIRIESRADIAVPCILFLDEIEMALHPSSLTRLLVLLKDISTNYNMAIYFSTHSIELIRDINPENIYFIERHSDNSTEIINPCYPSYATRILYDHTGYDYVILVEDDLAKEIISKLLRKYKLLNNKLVHVLPCGGWTNVIKLANDVIASNLVTKPSTFIIILDGDIEERSKKYLADKHVDLNIPLNYLPIESLEKYCKSKLFDNVDHRLFRLLNDYIFHQTSLSQISEQYKASRQNENDSNGKKFYSQIDEELKRRNKTRFEFVDIVVEYIMENEQERLERIKKFLEEKLS